MLLTQTLTLAELVTFESFPARSRILAGRRASITPRNRSNPNLSLSNFCTLLPLSETPHSKLVQGGMGVNYMYYRCPNPQCESPIKVRRWDLEDRFRTSCADISPTEATFAYSTEFVLKVQKV